MRDLTQDTRRTRGRVLVACLAVALPAFAASAAAGEPPAPPACTLTALSPAPAPAAPARGMLVPHESPVTNAERGFAVATGLMATGFTAVSDVPLVAIGSRFDGPAGGGAVYLFGFSTPSYQEQLYCASTQPGEQFGISVALHGGTLVVGAPGRQQPDQERPGGTVYVFQLMFIPLEGGGGFLKIEQKGTIASPLAGLASLGRAVALDGTHLAVSATMPGAGGVLGAVLVYSLPYVPGSTPLVLMPPVPQPGDRFGESLALSSGTLIVGAPGRTGLAGQAAAGAVYLFPLAGGGQPVNELRPLQEAADAQFGSSLSASGSSLAVGAVGAGATAGLPFGGPGAVYVFTGGNSTWTQQVLAPDLAHAAMHARFGQAVAIDGDFLAAGAPLSSVAKFFGGAAFLFQFQRETGVWAEVPANTVDDAEPHALLGSAVALLKGTFFVGAPLANQARGAVYTYPYGVPVTTAGAASTRSFAVPAAHSSGGGARGSDAAASPNPGGVQP